MDHPNNTLKEIFQNIFGLSDEDNVDGEDVVQEFSNAMLDSNFNSNSVEEGPKIGMLFSDIASLYDFYQQHARQKGFSVAKKSSSKGKGHYRKYQTISCDRGRKPYEQKASKRIDCPVKINAVLQDNETWMVTKVTSEHNHDTNPSLSRFMPTHRHLTPAMKRTLEANDIAGIRPCKSIRMLEIGAGGPENLSCLSRDCRNFIDQRRRFRISDGDDVAVRMLFLKMQEVDSEFYYAIVLDNELRLCNVFWVHPRGRVADQEFHDVVTFDTTYLVNRYKMPFATFVGVNHHGQSILLGYALLSHENAKSFKWLFRTWITAMGGVHPNAILIDQCESTRKAIREDMPNTVHRFCLWHILCKVPEKFKGVVQYDDAIIEFKALIYDSLSSQMFEDNWRNFIVKYGLERNEWLRKLYLDKEHWVLVYLRHIFWTGMLSTQRS